MTNPASEGILSPEKAIRELIAFIKKRPQQVFFDNHVKTSLKTPVGHIENCAQAFLFGALPRPYLQLSKI